MGRMQFEQKIECPVCHGQGFPIHASDKCKKCQGQKMNREKSSITIQLPKGLEEGNYVIANNYADEYPFSDTGDLYVEVTSAPHSFFKRVENVHLEFTAEISLLESLTGFKRKVKHISGELITVRREDEITPHGNFILHQLK